MAAPSAASNFFPTFFPRRKKNDLLDLSSPFQFLKSECVLVFLIPFDIGRPSLFSGAEPPCTAPRGSVCTLKPDLDLRAVQRSEWPDCTPILIERWLRKMKKNIERKIFL
jgi:hypothetical protein